MEFTEPFDAAVVNAAQVADVAMPNLLLALHVAPCLIHSRQIYLIPRGQLRSCLLFVISN